MTGAPGLRRGRLVLAAAAATVLLPLTAGCSGSDHPAVQSPAAVHRSAEQLLLDRRAQAVRDHNLHAFMRTVARGDADFRRWQRAWFRNVEQLPVSRFSYRVLDGSWPHRMAPRSGGRTVLLPRVRVTLRLAGYDSAPERRTTGFAFEYRSDGLKVVADRTRAGRAFPGSDPAPWDVAPIGVRRGVGVLGIFDHATVEDADRLLPVVEEGIRQVSEAVPFTWPRRVVVYLFHEPRLLDSFSSVPGGNIRHLGAMSFPVRGADSRPVAMRFTLLPSSVAAGEPFLGRITRHELTHVALGTRDDGDPEWVDEGVAEYVGARPLPRSQRGIATVAVARARRGVDAMPPSRGFNGDDQDWHYALAWMACDYIAATRGEAKLWDLVRALHDHGRGTTDADQDPVLRRVLGYDSHELARRAAQRILSIYG